MTYIKPNKIKKIKELDLLTYLQNYEPDRLKRLSHDTYCVKDHDSLHISNGLWHWLSQGFGGRSALDFLIKVDGYDFKYAVQYLIDKTNGKEIVSNSYEPITKKSFYVPMKASNEDNAKQYLLSRGISSNIVNYCFDYHLIYQSDIVKNDITYSNICFLGYDRKINLPRHVSMRGIGTDFKGDSSGSDKHYPFCIEPNNSNCNIVHVTEGAIDTLSLATLFEMDGKEFNQHYILSLTGIAVPQKETETIKMPIALEQFLSDHPNVNTIVLHLDLDKVGRRASYLIQKMIKDTMPNYTCIDEPPKHYKDLNDTLCIELGLNNEHKKITKTDDSRIR